MGNKKIGKQCCIKVLNVKNEQKESVKRVTKVVAKNVIANTMKCHRQHAESQNFLCQTAKRPTASAPSGKTRPADRTDTRNANSNTHDATGHLRMDNVKVRCDLRGSQVESPRLGGFDYGTHKGTSTTLQSINLIRDIFSHKQKGQVIEGQQLCVLV